MFRGIGIYIQIVISCSYSFTVNSNFTKLNKMNIITVKVTSLGYMNLNKSCSCRCKVNRKGNIRKTGTSGFIFYRFVSIFLTVHRSSDFKLIRKCTVCKKSNTADIIVTFKIKGNCKGFCFRFFFISRFICISTESRFTTIKGE